MATSERIEGLEWHARRAEGPRRRPLARDPARLVTLVGGLLMFVGCLLPWASGRDGRGVPVAFGANDGSADGVFLVVAAVVIILLTLSGTATFSTSRSLQLAPFAAGAVAALVWISGERSSRFAVDAWHDMGGGGSQTWALWATLAGIGIGTLGSVLVYVTRPADVRARTSSIAKEWDLTGTGVVEAVGAIAGAVVGGGAGLLIGITLGGYIGVLLMVLLTAFGVMFGMQAGMAAVRWLFRRMASY